MGKPYPHFLRLVQQREEETSGRQRMKAHPIKNFVFNFFIQYKQ